MRDTFVEFTRRAWMGVCVVKMEVERIKNTSLWVMLQWDPECPQSPTWERLGPQMVAPLVESLRSGA